MSDRLLTIYVQDHLAAATGGLALAARARDAQEGRDAELHGFLADLTTQISADREQVVRCLDCLGARPDRLKVLAAAGAERVGRLLPNGRIATRSPLSDLIELEGLTIAVQGKRAGWVALRESAHPRLATIDFDLLVGRAEEQWDGIEAHRRPLAARVLAAD